MARAKGWRSGAEARRGKWAWRGGETRMAGRMRELSGSREVSSIGWRVLKRGGPVSSASKDILSLPCRFFTHAAARVNVGVELW